MRMDLRKLIRRTRRQGRILGSALLGLVMVGALAFAGLTTPIAAQASTVNYQFTGAWQSPPAQVRSGVDALSAIWYFDINDNSPAPTNNPVDNNTVTFTAQNATFSAIPAVCLTSGVTPVSSLSADGKTLVCNIGTRDQGTAQVAFTGLVPQGNSGDMVSVTGVFMGNTVVLPQIPIVNPFIMDAKFDGASTSTPSGTQQLLSFGWSVSHSQGSLPGPSTVSYDLTLNTSNGETLSLNGTGCSPISTAYAGYPYSDTTHPQNVSAPFPGCTLISLGGNKFRLTLTGLSYTAPAPTYDSRGSLLPSGMDVIAAGLITLKLTYGIPGTLTLDASTPTYVAPSNPAVTSVDKVANNHNSQPYTRGSWTHAFLPEGPLVQGSVWTDTYRTQAGASVVSGAWTNGIVGNGVCEVVDTKYATFQSAQAVGANLLTGATFWYYVGTGGGLLDPALTSYDPNAWTGCGQTSPDGGKTGWGSSEWTSVAPADLSTVKAVMLLFTQPLIDQGVSAAGYLGLRVRQQIKSTVPVGTDIWSWGSYKDITFSNTWQSPNRSTNVADKPSYGTATPGYRYPFAAAGRDVLKTISSVPVVVKDVTQKEAGPGTQVDYTLHYGLSADAGAGAPAQVVLVDTLPAGLAYVTGSSTPAPVITGTVAAGQTLTWTIANVSVNKTPLDVINFKALVPVTAVPGSTYTNNVTATSQGLSATASAQFTVPKAGYTTLKKTAITPVVPSANGVAQDGWTVTMTSNDPVAAANTDTVDILPYIGDGRGTAFNGSYQLKQALQAVAGATVYYSTAPSATINEDPQDPSNGGFATITGNTVGWSTIYTPNATAVRVIGPGLAYGQSQAFTVQVVTSGSKGGDIFVNTAVGRSTDTQLRMRTSAQFSVAVTPAVALKKYVRDSSGAWHDAQDPTDYPSYNVGDTVRYRVVVQNTGNMDLADVPLADDKVNLGQLFQDGKLTSDVPLAGSAASGLSITSLKIGENATIEYDIVLADVAVAGGNLVNTACTNGPAKNPQDGTSLSYTPSCDPAGVKVLSSLAWEKIGAYSATTFLDGSGWELVQVTGDGGVPVAGAAAISVTDCVAAQAADCTGADIDPQAGRFKVMSLQNGWYRLTETNAPVGYKLDATPHYVQASGVSKISEGIVNEVTDVPQLPLTGGVGSLGFWAGGGLGGLLVAAGLFWQRRKTLKS